MILNKQFAHYLLVWVHIQSCFFFKVGITQFCIPLLFFKLYFIVYAIIAIPVSSPSFPPTSSTPHYLRQSPHCWPCPQVVHICSLATLFPMLYFISTRLFCKYQFVIFNPFTLFTHPLMTLPSGNHQNVLYIYDFASVLLICLICFFRFN